MHYSQGLLFQAHTSTHFKDFCRINVPLVRVRVCAFFRRMQTGKCPNFWVRPFSEGVRQFLYWVRQILNLVRQVFWNELDHIWLNQTFDTTSWNIFHFKVCKGTKIAWIHWHKHLQLSRDYWYFYKVEKFIKQPIVPDFELGKVSGELALINWVRWKNPAELAKKVDLS